MLQNDTSLLKETVHNVGLSEETGSLWMLDNEAAFLRDSDDDDDSDLMSLHRRSLRSSCAFRRRTAERLFALRRSGDPARLLLRFAAESEPLLDVRELEASPAFARRFAERVEEVWSWVRLCQEKAHFGEEN